MPARLLDAATVVETLVVSPVSVEAVLGDNLLPSAPGFYAWWARQGAIPGVPLVPRPRDPRLGLFYVGISPSRPASKQDLRKRVVGNHLRGNIRSSTFRFALAALLVDSLQLTPIRRGTKTVLDAVGEAAISAWQHENLLLTWCVPECPWEVEEEVIALMQPPLNCAANTNHPFYPRVREARDELRRRSAGTARSS